MVSTAWDYKWSSARFHVGKSGSDILVKDRTLMGLVTDWEGFLTVEDQEQDKTVRAGSKIGRPTGSESFLQKVEEITGRDLVKGKAGRPVK